MSIVNPPSGRHEVSYLSDSLEIIIPSRKQWFQVAYLGFWLVGWSFGEIIVGGMLLSGLVGLLLGDSAMLAGDGDAASSGVSLFMLAWFCAWTIGGAFAWYGFLWQLAGKEIVRVSPRSILIGRQIFGIKRIREYLAEYIKALRISPPEYSPFSWSKSSRAWGLSGGLLAFDYGANTVRFGSGVDEAEAKQILATIQERFPQYQSGTI